MLSMSNRLDTVAPGLSAMLEEAERHLRDRVVLEACQRAVSAAMAANSLLDHVLNQLRNKAPGTDWERADLLRRLGSLQKRLDEEYLQLQERAEAEPESENSYLGKFRQARAIGAVIFALRGKAAEAVYEASAAVWDGPDLVAGVRAALTPGVP
jgi:hypothetical protein